MSVKKYLILFDGVAKSKDELRAFNGFVKKSSVKNKEEVLILYDLLKRLKRSSKNFLEEKLDEKIYQKMLSLTQWKNEKAIQKFRKLTSDFSLLLMEFLTLVELKQSPFIKKQLLAKTLKERGLDKFFVKENLEILKQSDQVTKISDFAIREWAFEELYYHPNAKLHSKKENRLNLLDSIAALDQYYIGQKLKKGCELIILKIIYGESLGDRVDKDMEFIVQNWNPANNHPFLIVFKLAADFFLVPDKIKHDKLASAFNEMHESLGDERWTILRFMIVGMNLIETDSRNKMLEIFKHYQFAIKHGLLVGGGYISLDSFNNIVYTACHLGETEYAKQFISSHLQYLKLGNDLHESIELLFESYILFEDAKYEEVVEKLSRVHYVDFSYGIRKHVLLLKSILESDRLKKLKTKKNYIESEYEVEAYSSTVKIYLNRQFKGRFISKEVRDKNLNFVYMVRMIHGAAVYKHTKEDVLVKMEEMKTDIVESSWLWTKIKQLGIKKG